MKMTPKNEDDTKNEEVAVKEVFKCSRNLFCLVQFFIAKRSS